MNQREAVYAAITAVLSNHNIAFEDGDNVSTVLTKDHRGEAQAILCEGFRAGRIDFAKSKSNDEKLADSGKLSSYVSGLISNWVRKDTRLNGEVKYTPKNPGSRAGSGDEQMKTLRALQKQFAGDAAKLEIINAQVEARKAEIAASKSKAVELTDEQIEKLPAELREALGL